MNMTTHMRRELLEIPNTVARHLNETHSEITHIARLIRTQNPDLIITVARGSSDHAATFLKYICEIQLGIPVASVGPSIASVYNAQLHLKNAVCVSISQSGQSPDVVSMTASADKQGALSIAITNELDSPLAKAGKQTIPMMAGPERSVAATKTFIVSLVASLALVAHIKGDKDLIRAIEQLPEFLNEAVQFEWTNLCDAIIEKNRLYVLGRGISFAVAKEAALKFKETCLMHATSYSSAEVLHGPVEIIGNDFPVLAMVARDATEMSIIDVCEKLSQLDANVFATSDKVKRTQQLDFVSTAHPMTDPIAVMTSFYAFVEKLAIARGFNPDKPSHLNKVTETI